MSMISELLKIIKELLDFVDDKIKPAIIESLNKQGISSFDSVDIFLFTKSTKTFRALFILCHQKYGEDAAVLARSILENLINLAYIKKGGSRRRAKLFSIYSFIARKKFMNNNPDVGKRIDKEFYHRHGKSLRTAEAFYKKECARIKKKYGRRDNNRWSCLSIKEMCGAVGKKFKKFYYNKVYRKLCQFSHPDVDGSKGYFYEDKDGLTINDLPNGIWVEESLVVGFDCYSRILYLFNEIFRLGFEDEIKKIEKKYLKIFSK